MAGGDRTHGFHGGEGTASDRAEALDARAVDVA